MRILLSGGIKTQNIVSGIQKKFTASGDDFIVIEYLDDIDDMFSRGEYFDKALVTEQSITRDYSITDEYTIRKRVNDFANIMKAKPRKFNFVFLAQEKTMANMIHEEILPILGESAVVLKEPPYTVPFFVSILVTDSKQLPDEIVYTPELKVKETPEITDDSAIFEDMDMAENVTNKVAPDNFDLEMFGVTDDFKDLPDDFKVTDEIELDEGEEDIGVPIGGLEVPDFDDEEEPENENEALEISDEDYTEPEVYNPTGSNTFNENWGEKDLNLEGINPIKQSGELNNYIEETPVDESINETTQDTGYIPGFDEPEEQSEYDQNLMMNDGDYIQNDQSVYTPEENTNQYIDNPGDFGYTEPSLADNDNQIQYDTDEFSSGFDNYSQDNILPGFDTSDYTNSDAEQDYQNNMEQNMYQPEEQAGFSADDYSDDVEEDHNESSMTTNGISLDKPVQSAQSQKKKGLFGKLVGGSTQVPQQQQVQPNNVAKNKQSAMMNNLMGMGKLSPDTVRNALKPFAARGNSIVVTGCGGCGTSTIAYSLASMVAQLGYTVLLVDMDTEGRTQSYISRDNYESMEPDGANLMSAVNSSNGINTHISVVRQGFHLLTMGLGTDTAPVNELLHKEKISRFVNLAKTSHNFVIYDIPFNVATGFLSDIVYMSDNLVLVTDASNWGITKTMLSVCNIPSEDMQDTVFNRAQIVFNKYRNLYKVLGKKVRTCVDITRVMDQKVLELVGDDPGFHFEDLHIAGIINDDPDFEQGWFDDVQYVDTKKGQQIFLELVEHIVLKK